MPQGAAAVRTTQPGSLFGGPAGGEPAAAGDFGFGLAAPLGVPSAETPDGRAPSPFGGPASVPRPDFGGVHAQNAFPTTPDAAPFGIAGGVPPAGLGGFGGDVAAAFGRTAQSSAVAAGGATLSASASAFGQHGVNEYEEQETAGRRGGLAFAPPAREVPSPSSTAVALPPERRVAPPPPPSPPPSFAVPAQAVALPPVMEPGVTPSSAFRSVISEAERELARLRAATSALPSASAAASMERRLARLATATEDAKRATASAAAAFEAAAGGARYRAAIN